ncbi:hypothetical protein ABT007_26770 [Streptomyces griseus]|uniref:hypothetical protein n=1 Tax=Streptomyces griseus TaxID=1911 RepID=UPI00332AD870
MASSGQLEFPGFAPEVPDLTRYRWILANLSGGKDSQAMLVELMRHARAPGVVDRIVVVHADLGDAEWEGAVEPAAEHAAFYGLWFEVVARTGGGVIDRIGARHVPQRRQPMVHLGLQAGPRPSRSTPV